MSKKLTKDDFPFRVNKKCRQAFSQKAKVERIFKESIAAAIETAERMFNSPWDVIAKEHPELQEFLNGNEGLLYLAYNEVTKTVYVKRHKE